MAENKNPFLDILQGKELSSNTAETVKKNFAANLIRMGMLIHPEYAITYSHLLDKSDEQLKNRCYKLVEGVAQKTGAEDLKQIADKKKRTHEQDQLLKEAVKQRIEYVLAGFLTNAAVEASKTLRPLIGTYKNQTPKIFNSRLELKLQAVFYFFAIHDELKPYRDTPLTDEQKNELRDIYTRLDAFYVERAAKGEPEEQILNAFIEHENPNPEKAKIITERLLVQGIRPTAHVMPNNALANILQQKPAINAGEFDMVVSNAKGSRKEITAYTMISLDPGNIGNKITGATKLTEYERQVSDAVISLWIEASKKGLPPVFSPEIIYRSMPGGGDKPSTQQKGAITKTIEKLRRLHITVDATEEMRKRGVISQKETFKIDNFYFSATHVECKTKNGGHTVKNAYKLDTEPIILTYCKMTKQLLTVPAKYLIIRKVKNGKITNEILPMNIDRQSMTGYMLRRIEVMDHDKKCKKQTQSNVILFDTLFTEAGTKTDNRQQTMHNRNFCFLVLDYWKAAGYIKGYEKQVKGRSITGVAIAL